MKFVINLPNKNSKKVPTTILRKNCYTTRTFAALYKRARLEIQRRRKKKIYAYWGDISTFKRYYKNKVLWLQEYVDCLRYRLGT